MRACHCDAIGVESGEAMGIRFLCPNGHKLNVKSFLAGKKAFCPVCGVRLTVPVESTAGARPSRRSTPGGRHSAGHGATAPFFAAPAAGPLGAPPPTTMAPPGRIAIDQPQGGAPLNPAVNPSMRSMASMDAAPSPTAVVPAVPVMPRSPFVEPVPAGLPTVPGLPDPLAEAGDVVWYVRPPSGGQYGPATAAVMRGWIQEGRVSADSLVWREGWREWQEAGRVFPQLAHGSDVAAPNAVPAAAPAVPRIPRRRSSTTQAAVIALLVLAVIVLAVIFAWVLMQQPAAGPDSGAPQAKPTAMILRPDSERTPAAIGT